MRSCCQRRCGGSEGREVRLACRRLRRGGEPGWLDVFVIAAQHPTTTIIPFAPWGRAAPGPMPTSLTTDLVATFDDRFRCRLTDEHVFDMMVAPASPIDSFESPFVSNETIGDQMDRPPDAVYAEVRATDPDVLDGDGLADHLRRLAVLRAWLDAEQVRSTRAQRRLASEGRAADPTSALARDGRQSSKDARTAAERETVCTAMPAFEDALADGTVSAGHVDAVATATRPLDETEAAEFAAQAESLLGDAERQGVDAFARTCRDLAKTIRAQHNARADVDELEQQRQRSKISRWVDKVTGMHHTHIECDPLTDCQIWAAIQHQRGKLRQRNQRTGTTPTPSTWDRLTVDALVEAVSAERSKGGRARNGLVVHIDLPTLTDRRHDTSLCETDSGVPLPIATVRRLACEADIIPVVLNGEGVVLDEGRARRLATFEQRVAIEAMQATCSHPDCSVTVEDCRIHHLIPWATGGRTDLADLVPLCERHHHLVHEGGWSLTVTPDRVATWTRPDGNVHWTGPLNDRHPIAA